MFLAAGDATHIVAIGEGNSEFKLWKTDTIEPLAVQTPVNPNVGLLRCLAIDPISNAVASGGGGLVQVDS